MKAIYFAPIIMFAAHSFAQPTLPPLPVSCSATGCITNSTIDVCPANSNNVVTNFQGKQLFTNNGNNGLSAGSVWRFRNIATVSNKTINAVVTVDAISNAVLDNVDDDAATDQDGNSIASFFAPRIGADQILNGTDRRGYVQFTIAFYRNSSGANDNSNSDFGTIVQLANLNYVHYDIDGNDAGNVNVGTAGSWFRETGMAKKVAASNPVVLGNIPTDLVSYNYTDPVSTSWTGFAGGICEQTGVSKCANVAASFNYNGAQSSVTVRMGYDYNAGGNIGQPIRQYGSRFGCFQFPVQAPLPVKLINFTASYRNQITYLNWETEDEIVFDHFDIERSTDGTFYSVAGTKAGQNNRNRLQYQFADNLSGVNGATFFYRLKMVDQDGKFRYSNVIVVRKDQKDINGISINPNPITGGMATVKMSATVNGHAELQIIDINGKILLKQQNKIYPGENIISVNNLDKLQPGIYTLQFINGQNIFTTRISVLK